MTTYVFTAKAPQRDDVDLADAGARLVDELSNNAVLSYMTIGFEREPVPALTFSAQVQADGRQELSRVMTADAAADTLKRALRAQSLRDTIVEGHMRKRDT